MKELALRKLKKAAVICLMLFTTVGMETTAPALALSPKPVSSLSELSWLAGKWKTKTENAKETAFEETWKSLPNGSMEGTGRELKNGKVKFSESLRIEKGKDGFSYVARPAGKAPTSFKLVGRLGDVFIFENPQHDFPKRISYEKRPDGSLCILVSGDGKTGERNFLHILHKQ